MDSMRQLSTSLPRRRNEQPHELLSDFKAAALSVTNLYKSAAAAQTKSRAAGYQDALDDLLAFLDQENMGLMDGEGWRVRQWATQRLVDDRGEKHVGSEDEQEEGSKEEEVADRRSSSPEVQRKPAMPVSSSELTEETSPHRRVVSEPPIPQPEAYQVPSVPFLPEFSFRSNQTMPSNHDRESGMEVDNSSTLPAQTNPDTVRIIPRSSRAKHTSHNRQRHEARTLNFNLGAGHGSKRKMPFPDFFNIDGMNPENNDGRRDGHGGRGGGGGGGGKRTRHV